MNYSDNYSDYQEAVSPFYHVPYTKFYIPYTENKIVNRENVLCKLNKAREKKLTIVNAPAGYGKSTAVSSWVKQNINNISCCWITLDEQDVEESVLWHNIIYSVNQNEKMISDQSVSMLSVEQCINLIINYFTQISIDCFIILDDFHNIENTLGHKSFEYLMTYLPRNLHFIIVSRMVPTVSLSRLMLEENIAIIDRKDLQFTPKEMDLFLNHIADLSLSEEELLLLGEKTEGWIAALKVAAAALINYYDKMTYIKNFDNNNEQMFQYLFEEVINSQPAYVKEFLLKTSILKIFNQSICYEVTGIKETQSILNYLHKNSLFIINLDDRKENYRYHPIMSEMLKKMLTTEHPEQIDKLYYSASSWYQKRGFYKEAIEYAIASCNHKLSIELLEKYFEAGYSDAIGPKSICNYFNLLPCELYNNNPILSIHYALALVETGQINKDIVELTEYGIYLDSDMFKGYEGLIYKLRAIVALRAENISDILSYSMKALELLPSNDISGVTLCLVIGYIYRALGALMEAEIYFDKALFISEKVSKIKPEEAMESLVLSSFYLISIKYYKGELNDFITPVKHMLTENITHKNCMYFCLAAAYYDYGELQMSYECVMQGLELCNTYDDVFYEKMKGYVLLARILYHSNKKTEVIEVMDQIDNMIKPESGNLFILLQLPEIIKLHHLMGTPERARRYLNLFQDLQTKEAEFVLKESQVELLTAEEEYEEAIKLLEWINANMDFSIYPKKKLELIILEAIIYQSWGKDEDAFNSLRKALEIKGATKLIRIFLDRGRAMRELLSKLHHQTEKLNEYELQITIEEILKGYKADRKAILPEISGFDRLSDRELEVLRLLSQGLSYGDIGGKLYITLSTVKKHTGNIYKKLKVMNRMQAVNIAKANDMI